MQVTYITDKVVQARICFHHGSIDCVSIEILKHIRVIQLKDYPIDIIVDAEQISAFLFGHCGK